MSYEAQDGFISFARGSTRWPLVGGRGCVVSYAMAIASVRETDRGSIGGSLEKLCDDGLMKSGSDMSQSHWLRVVECQGWNRAGASRRVRDACVRICTATGARPWPDRHSVGLYGSTGTFVLREWPPSPHLPWENWGRRWSGSPTVASAVYEGTAVLWTRPCWQAQLAHNVLRVELEDEKPGRPQH